ncbi:MAG: PTS sugar transporter subunit IIA [Geobacteraceae bacterium]|nr:PTS sugar transporter subunit IIA [Geobacteraceae bacterium]
MQLTVSEAARLLQADEKTVRNWIRKKGLPAVKINEQYRLNRVDLLEWATDQGIKLSPEIFAAARDEQITFPSLSQALEAGGIHYGVRGEDTQAVLGNVVALLKLPPQVDPEFLLQILLAREALGTTAIGDGIAIPHVRNPILLHVSSPAITLCFLEKPIDFNALDGKPVDVLFTLISPTAKTHLHLLAKLAYVLRDERFKEALRRRKGPADILAVVAAIEAELGGG